MAFFCRVAAAVITPPDGVTVTWELVDDTDGSVDLTGSETFNRQIDETLVEMEARIKAALTPRFNRVIASAGAVGGRGERLTSRLINFRVPPAP